MEQNQTNAVIPNIFEYYDYRQFLKDLVEYEKTRCSVFSNRYIVQKAGLKSPTALKHVIDGRRNMSLETANRFATAFKIEGKKRHYFLTLVLFNQTSSIAEREKYLNELFELKKSDNPSRLNEECYEVLANWYNLAIKEIVELPDYKNSAKWISRVLTPQVAINEVVAALNLLKRLGLIKSVDGHLSSVDKTLISDERVRSVKAVEFHRQMIRLGSEALTRFESHEREISGTTIRIASEDVENVKSLLREFRRKILNLAANSAMADQVYQLNFQFFPLAATDRKGRFFDEREKS